MDKIQPGADVFFLLMGAILVFAMHGGFAFLEVGTVRSKNQVNALCKILVDFAISTVAYFFVGFAIAYGMTFLLSAKDIAGGAAGFDGQGLTLVKFFFLCTFAAAIPAIISRRHCRTCTLPSAMRSHRADRRSVLSVFRRARMEQEPRPARRIFRGRARGRVPRFRGIDRRACVRRLGGAGGRAGAGRAQGPVYTGGTRDRYSTVLDSMARTRIVDAMCRLVRVQRHERAVAFRRIRTGGDELAAGHGRRYPGGTGRR